MCDFSIYSDKDPKTIVASNSLQRIALDYSSSNEDVKDNCITGTLFTS